MEPSDTQLARSVARERRIADEAMAARFGEEMLSSAEAARRLGAKSSNREKVNSFRRRSMLLGLPRDEGRQYLYPTFQIDVTRRKIHPDGVRVHFARRGPRGRRGGSGRRASRRRFEARPSYEAPRRACF